VASQVILNQARSFADIIPLVEQAEIKLSFWGTRYVNLPQLNTTLPIDAIAARVIEMMEQNPHFDENERAYGRRIAPLIDRIYQISEQQVAQHNCFTRLLVLLRNLRNILAYAGNVRTCSATLYGWRDCEAFGFVGYRQIFAYYTREQYQRTFHHFPEEAERHGNSISCDNDQFLPRWSAPQAIVREV
jgi:hypothetical protein